MANGVSQKHNSRAHIPEFGEGVPRNWQPFLAVPKRRQEAFCRLMLDPNTNPTKCGQRAGFAIAYGVQLSKKRHIVARIKWLKGETIDAEVDAGQLPEIADAREVLKELTNDFRNPKDSKIRLETATVLLKFFRDAGAEKSKAAKRSVAVDFGTFMAEAGFKVRGRAGKDIAEPETTEENLEGEAEPTEPSAPVVPALARATANVSQTPDTSNASKPRASEDSLLQDTGSQEGRAGRNSSDAQGEQRERAAAATQTMESNGELFGHTNPPEQRERPDVRDAEGVGKDGRMGTLSHLRSGSTNPAPQEVMVQPSEDDALQASAPQSTADDHGVR